MEYVPYTGLDLDMDIVMVAFGRYCWWGIYSHTLSMTTDGCSTVLLFLLPFYHQMHFSVSFLSYFHGMLEVNRIHLSEKQWSQMSEDRSHSKFNCWGSENKKNKEVRWNWKHFLEAQLKQFFSYIIFYCHLSCKSLSKEIKSRLTQHILVIGSGLL